MKLMYKRSHLRSENSFLAGNNNMSSNEDEIHFHSELEFVYVLKGKGTRYVGNSIDSFEAGELYLIGSNVPHLFKIYNEFKNKEGEEEVVELIVVKFKLDFLGENFKNIPETKGLQTLFENANRGIIFSKEVAYLVHKHFTNLVEEGGLSRIAGFLKILDVLLINENYKLLCSYSYDNSDKRMARVISYLHENFKNKIELETVAALAYMTSNSFCRFFKRQTQKSFIQYLNEIRISHACKLLIEGGLQITTICYLSGFNTPTNFNKQFKFYMNMTPRKFIKLNRANHNTELEAV